MNNKNTVKYRVWNGRFIVELDHEPTEEEGQLLRFTGILDKDGDAIYESDKVKMVPLSSDNPPIVGIVEFREDEQAFYVRHGIFLSKLDAEWHDLCVVGTAFEEI